MRPWLVVAILMLAWLAATFVSCNPDWGVEETSPDSLTESGVASGTEVLTLPSVDPDTVPDTQTDSQTNFEADSETEPVTEPPSFVTDDHSIAKSYDTFFVNGEMYFAEDGGADHKLGMQDNTVSFGVGEYCYSIALRGWIGCDQPIAGFGYYMDTYGIVYGDFAQETEDAVLVAGGAYASRFMITVPMEDQGVGSHRVGFVALLEDGTLIHLYETLIIVIAEMDPEIEPATDPTTDSESIPDTEPVTEPVIEPGDSAMYSGVLIQSVYGTGKKGAEALISNGYIQLYNKSNRDVALTGAALYYKTDNNDPFEQFVFPAGAIIPAGGYYLVRTLSPNGFNPDNAVMSVEHCDAEWDIYLDNKEVRLLLAPSGRSIPRDADVTAYGDAVSCFVATMGYHTSVYALYDLSRNKIAVRTAMEEYSGYHTVNLTRAATPELRDLRTQTSDGTVNEVVASRINEVLFSEDAGIYEGAFILRLTAKEGYTIYYTTDGSDPSRLSNSGRKTYRSGIMLTDTSTEAWGPLTQAAANIWGSPNASSQIGGHVIKAYATNGTDSTDVFTNTYFITDDLTKYGVSVMSISMPAAEVIGTNGFYNNFLVVPGNITGGRNRGVGIMEVFDPSGDRVGNSRVEMAVSGNGSSGWAMKSLRIYIKGANNQDSGLQSNLNYDIFGGEAKDAWGQAITSFSRLLIRNSGNDCGASYIRDAFMQSTAAGLNVDYMESTSTLVFINGEFWGVYNLRERYSPEYVESHYGVDKDNVAIIENDYYRLVTYGDTNAAYILSAGEEGDEIPFNEMVEYMNTHNLSNQADYEYVASLMDVDSFIDMWVVRLYYNARDWPENNVKVWRNKNPNDPSGFDTKWHFTLLDLDMGLSFYPAGHWADTSEAQNFFGLIDSNSVCSSMMRALLRNREFKQKFIERYYEVAVNHLTPEYLNAVFDEFYAEREPLMNLQQGRWHCDAGFTYVTWQFECVSIRRFLNNRQDYTLNHFFSYFGVSEEELQQSAEKKVTINFLSTRTDVLIDGEAVQNGTALSWDTDEAKVLNVVATPKEGYVVTSITFASRTGETYTTTGGNAAIRVQKSGTISISTQRVVADPSVFENATVVAGATYLFYLTGEGDLYAWGDNRHGVLGLGPTPSVVSTPTLVMEGVAKVVTSSGNAMENGESTFSTAILTLDGRLFTVGVNSCGQLCRNGTADDSRLGEVELDFRIKDISMGHDHLLILDEDDNLWGIGSNTYGALGETNVGGNITTLVRVDTDVAIASAGRRSTTYVKNDGTLWGLGDNRWQKLSRNHGDRILTPVQMAENIVFVDSGEHQILAVDRAGNLYYVGWRTINGFGQGDGNNPAMAYMLGNVKTADIYFGDMVALTVDGKAYVYGLNNENALGNAYTDGVPRQILDGVLDVAAGYGFTAYLMEDGSLRVQGNNTYGQTGNGIVGGTVHMSEIELPM